jgi:hypothetical protein
VQAHVADAHPPVLGAGQLGEIGSHAAASSVRACSRAARSPS